MNNNTRRLINELDNFVPIKNKDLIIETRGNNIISSAINFLNSLYENYPEDVAEDLKKRFFLSVKNHDPDKFNRKMRQIGKSK